MGRFIVRRLLQGALVVFLVTVVVFVTTRLVGDPVDVLLPFEATPEQRADFEHQLGLAVDFRSDPPVATLQGSWGATPAGKWMRNHAWEYGFIMSYPKGKMATVCYDYEPWHYRYVGRKAARRLKDLEREYGRKVSTHEFILLARCAFADELPDWESEDEEDAAAAYQKLCDRGVSAYCR